jgi:replicative DNA helicase
MSQTDIKKIDGELLPPHDISAEEALLGAVLIDDTVIDEITVKFDDFYHEPHRFIFKAFQNLYETKTHIDSITAGQELNRAGKLEAAGGVSYLLYLPTVCPSPYDAMVYADIVRRMSISRQMIIAGREIENMGYSNPVDSYQALTKCDEKLANIRKAGLISQILSPGDRAEGLYRRYNELYEKKRSTAISTGITKLDAKLGGGFFNGDVIIVAGRTGMGKTTLMSFLCNDISSDRNVLFCSAEMNSDSLSDREIAKNAGITTTRVRLGNYDDEMFAKILNGIGMISEKKIYIYDEIPMTTDKILQAALTMKLRHGLGAVVIDYMGILSDEYGRSTYERVSYISRKIKEIARILDVPVIVAAQLSREIEKRESKRPQTSDLRDSGNIEQDADVILLLYRESYYDIKKEDDDLTEIIIAKNRQGQSNRIVKVYYNKDTQAYFNDKVKQEELL